MPVENLDCSMYIQQYTAGAVISSFLSQTRVLNWFSCRIVDHASMWVPPPQVEAFLTELYHGKPKSSDLARFVEKMEHISGEGKCGEGKGCRVTLEDIRSAMAQLKKEVWCFVYC